MFVCVIYNEVPLLCYEWLTMHNTSLFKLWGRHASEYLSHFSESTEINQVAEASSSKDDEVTNGTTEVEATTDEKEATEEVKGSTEETKVDSEKETTSATTMVQIPGSASVTVTSEGSSSKKPTPEDHEERSVDPPPPG